MEALLEALTLYAEENLIFPLVQAYTPQIRGARIRADKAGAGRYNKNRRALTAFAVSPP